MYSVRNPTPAVREWRARVAGHRQADLSVADQCRANFHWRTRATTSAAPFPSPPSLSPPPPPRLHCPPQTKHLACPPRPLRRWNLEYAARLRTSGPCGSPGERLQGIARALVKVTLCTTAATFPCTCCAPEGWQLLAGMTRSSPCPAQWEGENESNLEIESRRDSVDLLLCCVTSVPSPSHTDAHTSPPAHMLACLLTRSIYWCVCVERESE